MDKEDESDLLRKRIRDARSHGAPINQIDIAKGAVEAEMPTSAAVRELRWASENSDVYTPGFMLADMGKMALSVFVSVLCMPPKDILPPNAVITPPNTAVLEFSSNFSLLTAGLGESDDKYTLTVLARDPLFAECLKILFEGKSPSVLLDDNELRGKGEYGTIICTPPVGLRSLEGERADGFGGEILHELVHFLSEGGMLYWITNRAVLSGDRGIKTLSKLKNDGLHVVAVIDLPPGSLSGTSIAGSVIIFRQGKETSKRFIANLEDLSVSGTIAAALLMGPSKEDGASWTWLRRDNPISYEQIERERLLNKLMPRGNYTIMALRSLLSNENVAKADEPEEKGELLTVPLFVPLKAGAKVTADIEEQSEEPGLVYRLEINQKIANPRYLVRLLNSPFGKLLREGKASGGAFRGISVKNLLSLELPIPDIKAQENMARIDGDIQLVKAAFQDMQNTLDQDWSSLPEVFDKIDGLNAVLDTERQIEDWWRELPYPLATIYRRYQVSTNSKEKLGTLLHFFEMAAVYLAVIGVSHVKAMRPDWEIFIPKWLHPSGSAGIERADFGFWNHLARTSLKDLRRIASNQELSRRASEIAGPGLVEAARIIGTLGSATEVLDVPRSYRNSVGHGGLIKPNDAERYDSELQQSIRDFYAVTSSVFRQIHLVLPGMAEGTEKGMKYEVEMLSGSDPTFEKQFIELDRNATTNVLAFWMSGARAVCRAVPFFRLGTSQQLQETSFYIYNRVEKEGFRWVSFQEAKEQAIVASNEELLDLISMEHD